MKPIIIQEKTRGRLLGITAEINRLSDERAGLLTAVMEANDIKNPEGYAVAPDYSRITPPPEPKEEGEKEK